MSPMDATAVISLEQLLEHRTWVRALARQLVWDPADVDDVEQETWLVAAKRPPRPGNARAWLAGVVRRVAARRRRTALRLNRKQASAPLRPPAVSAQDLVVQAEQHRGVVEALLALDEPYRTTLLLRYFEGLPPREIARRTETPVETVRSRTRRGLEQMRERLDRQQGSRRAWQLALAPLVGIDPALSSAGSSTFATQGAQALAPTSTAATTGALLMSMKTKWILGAAVLALLGWFALYTPPDSDPEPEPLKLADTPLTAPSPDLGPTLDGAPSHTDTPVQSEPDAAPSEPTEGRWLQVVRLGTQPPARPAVLEAKFVDEEGAVHLVAGSQGLVVLPDSVPERAALWLGDPEQGGMLFIAPRVWPLGRTELALPAVALCRAVFTDGQGGPLSRAEVERRGSAGGPAFELRWVSEELFRQEDPLRSRLESTEPWTMAATWSWAEDELRISNAPSTGSWRLLLSRAHATPLLLSVSADASGQLERLTLPLPVMPMQRVRCVDAQNGDALADAEVTPFYEVGDDEAFFEGMPRHTDAFGEIDIPVEENRPTSTRAPSWWLRTPTHMGRLKMWRSADPTQTVLVGKIYRKAAVRGVAYTAGGKVAAGCLVLTTEKGLALRTRTDATGAFELPAVHLESSGPPGTAPTMAMLMLVETEAPWQFRMQKVAAEPGKITAVQLGEPKDQASVAVVQGRISAGGRPLEGQFVLHRGEKSPAQGGKGAFVRTDAEGRYRLDGLLPGPSELLVYLGNPKVSDDYSIRPLGTHEAPGTQGLTLVAGETTTLDFDLPAGAILVTVLDDTGKPLVGVSVMAKPAESGLDEARFAGYRFRMGWSAMSDTSGQVLLLGLAPGQRFTLFGGVREQNWKFEQADALASSHEAPTEVTIVRRPTDSPPK